MQAGKAAEGKANGGCVAEMARHGSNVAQSIAGEASIASSATSPLLVEPMRRQASRGCRQGKFTQHSHGTGTGRWRQTVVQEPRGAAYLAPGLTRRAHASVAEGYMRSWVRLPPGVRPVAELRQ